MYGWKKLSIQQKCSWNTVRQEPFSKLLYCANYYVLPCVEKSLQSTDMLDCFQGLQMLRHKDMYVSYTKHLCLHVLQIFPVHAASILLMLPDMVEMSCTKLVQWMTSRTMTTRTIGTCSGQTQLLFFCTVLIDSWMNTCMDEGRLKFRGLTILIHVLDSNCKPGNFPP